MYLLVQNADLRCGHNGRVGVRVSQHLVFSEGRALLLRPDVEGRPIAVCMLDPSLKPCASTHVLGKGYSSLVFVNDVPVALSNAEGLTDGMSSANVKYTVRAAGQDLSNATA